MFSFYARLSVMFGFGTSENITRFSPSIPSQRVTEYDVNAIGASIGPGIAYSINDWIAIEASVGSLGYSKYTYELTTSDDGLASEERKNEDLNLIFSLTSISLGFQIIL